MKQKRRCGFHVQLGNKTQWEHTTMFLRYTKGEPLPAKGQTVFSYGMAGKYEVKILDILSTVAQAEHILVKARVQRRLIEPRISQG